MSMITQIKNEDALKPFLADKCEDNGVYAIIEASIKEDEIAIVKVDDYYNTIEKSPNIPPSADFLISVDCINNWYALYVIEFKNINSPKCFNVRNIWEKFRTTVEDFMSVRFAHIYENKNYKINDLLIYFIADPYRLKRLNITYDEYKSKRLANGKSDSTRVDNLLSQKPLRYRGKIYIIKYELPPNPVIRKLVV